MSELLVNTLSTLDNTLSIEVEDLVTRSNRSSQSVDSIAQLRALPTTSVIKYATTGGYYAKGDGGHGNYFVPSSFIGLADGKTTILADDGGFWCLEHNGTIEARQGGLLCDGVTDDAPLLGPLVQELSLVGPNLGAVIELTPRDRLSIFSSVTFEGNLWIKGSVGAGSNLNNTTAAQITQSGSAILIDPAVTIPLKGSSRVSGVVFLNRNISGNQPNSSAFAGTAVTAAGDDIRFDYCSFMGFNLAFFSDGFARASFDHCNFDNNSGIDIRNCFDIPRITQCHFWPWLSVLTGNVGNGTANALYRPGKAVSLNNVSWPEIDGIFTFGYQVGLDLTDCTNPTVKADLEGSRDAVNAIIPTIGCRISGNTLNGSYQLDTAHHQYGLYQALNLGVHSRIVGGHFRDSSTAGVYIETGDATIDNNATIGLATGVGGVGILVKSTAGVVVIPTHRTNAEAEGIRIENTLTAVRNVFSSGTTTPVNSTLQQWQITAAATLPIRGHNDHWYVAGTTGITNFLETFSGHRITIVFTQALTLTDGAGAGAVRVPGGSLAVTAGQTMQFVCNGITGAMTWRKVV